MSYFSGTELDFEARLHGAAETIEDLNGYLVEGLGYKNASPTTLQKWNREFAKKWLNFSGGLTYYDAPPF